MGHVHHVGASSRGGVNLLAISERLAVMPNRVGLSLVGCVGHRATSGGTKALLL